MGNVTVRELQMALLRVLEDFDQLCSDYNLQYSLAAGTLLGAVRHKGFIPWDDDVDLFMKREYFDRLMAIDIDEITKRGYTLEKPFSQSWSSGYGKFCKNGTTYLENYQYNNKKQHHGIFVDIFPVDNLSDKSVFQRLQWFSYRIITAKALANRGYSTNSFGKKMAMALTKNIPDLLFKRVVINAKENNSKQLHSFFGSARYFERNIYPRDLFDDHIWIEFEGKKFPVMKKYKEVLTIQYGDYMKLPPEQERIASLHAVAIDLTRSWSDEEISNIYHR